MGEIVATVYRSKIDWWIGLLGVVAILVSIVAGLKALSSYSPDATLNALLVGGPGTVIPLLALLTTRYTIKEKQLFVRSGPIRWRIPIADISAITPSHDPIASPALSLNRLRIEYGRNKSLLISPRKREDFLRHIEKLRSAV